MRRRVSIVRWPVSLLAAVALCLPTPSFAQSADHSSPSGSLTATPAAVRPAGIVHIDAPQKVDLEIRNVDGDWERLCASPCDRAVPSDGEYRITGGGIRDSKTFRLDPAQRTTLTIDPTSSGARAGAVILTVVGSVGLLPIAGVSVLLAGGELFGAIFICPLAAAFETVKSQQGAEYGDCLGAVASFFAPAYAEPWVWVPAVAGAAMLTGGIVGLANTPHTGVHASSASSAAFRPVRPLTFEAIRLPQPISYPLIDVRF
jgi:hypothetical protein